MKMKLHQFEMRLRRPFTISRETRTVQPIVVVELCESELTGLGAATQNAYYGTTVTSITQDLERVRKAVESHMLEDPAEFWNELEPHLAGDRFAQCALDEAAWDLWGKKLGRPLHQIWGSFATERPPTCYTLGIDPIDVMIEKMNEMPNWPIYKVKLGTKDDVAIMRALREHTDAKLLVDANCGWTVEETITNACALKELQVEFVEQPLPADDWKGMQRVRDESPLPIMADESCVVAQDIDRCSKVFDGVNIKLVKCGGLTPARRMIDRARELGLKTMVGCMTESVIGISAAAQLLPQLDYADMDGPLLLRDDVATGVRIDQGRIEWANENGCGAQWV